MRFISINMVQSLACFVITQQGAVWQEVTMVLFMKTIAKLFFGLAT